ncbi:Imidazolonepropionase [Dirofilaria immitis]
MPSFRPWINHFHKTLLSTLICYYLLADHATGINDGSNFMTYPAYRQDLYGMNDASHLRSLRSDLGMNNIGHVEDFNYPLASRSAAMISGRGFRPGKRYDAGIISFI